MSFMGLPLARAAMFVLRNEVGSSVFRTHDSQSRKFLSWQLKRTNSFKRSS